MKVSKSTRDRIATIKDEAEQAKRHLENLHIRLSEHSGTKRIASKLERVIEKLEEWRKVA